MAQIEIPSSFGWVVFVAIAAIIVVMWKGFLVGGARKRFGVKYPTMYLPEVRATTSSRPHARSLSPRSSSLTARRARCVQRH